MKVCHFKIRFFLNACGRVILCLGLYFTVVSTLTTHAVAGSCAPGDTWANICRSTSNDCAPAGGTCQVAISYNGAVTVSPDPICAERGTIIQWYENLNNTSFTVTFPNSPFTDNHKILVGFRDGANVQSPLDTVGSFATDCYQYTIQECTSAGCYSIDPKVIVNPAGPTAPLSKTEHHEESR
jgi:hypothetical protein